MSGRRHKAERIRTPFDYPLPHPPRLLIGNFQIGGTIPRPRGAITGCLHSRTEGRWKTRAQVEHSFDGKERGGRGGEAGRLGSLPCITQLAR